MKDFYRQYQNDICSHFSVIIEIDGKTCYAYLLKDQRIIGDVWLYNNIDTPNNVDWYDKSGMPFLNPRAYAIDAPIFIITSPEDVNLKWTFKEYCRLEKVEIYIKNTLVAVMNENSKPGWSINAKVDGPLAKVLANDRSI